MSDVEKVISYFKKVCSIPRASGDEKAVSDYIVDFARDRGLDVTQDSCYNVIVRKPAAVPDAGEPVILQGHLDMVYVKENGSSHVYENGIEVKEDDAYYYADGTSLGSDNGIAVAYCLAVLDSDDIPHPDLEIVFTVKEEVGLVGADKIDISSLKGTRFINLDSEEEGIFYTSCAGGLRCRMIWDLETEKMEEERVPLRVTFRGLAGGHSGINIGMGLGNSIVLLGRLLYFLKDMQVRVNHLDAPGKANAIANNGSVCLYVKPEELDEVKAKLAEAEKTFQTELQYTDSISFEIEEGAAQTGAEVYTAKYQKEITESLMLLPYGVSGYSFAIDGLIETSMNLGSLTCEDGKLTLLMSLRSSVASQKYMLRDKIQIIADSKCDTCIFESDYPGWQYRKDSPLRDTAIALYEKLFHKKAEVAAIHAGLECGYWDSKKPGMDIISTGPDLFDVHSTKEKVSKESIGHMWLYLKELLKELSKA
ncbi:aminoacyl-histidine dipeptidase [Faecalicatena orotica]|uniref:Dipeptidase D n=1 Tax=Faecalicatena orotica TaxID=1544 RepID=A0A2Y9BHU8_9FIRM|nr:beta-Ala-His dipeptidase [Faecalicatena orotica]PWJ28026.1 dipeptidase D [Faecalicatena orotica]SSA57050.1 dipeptidase D [Faecalicatena orotica]